MNFKNLDTANHIVVLHFLSRQQELHKMQREIVLRYIAMALSENIYVPHEEHLADDIQDIAMRIMSKQAQKCVSKGLNDQIMGDFAIILEHVPAGK